MGMIDIDKFICSLIEQHLTGSMYKASIQYLLDALKDQGIIYKDGSLQILANSCESSKDSQRMESAKAKEEGE